MSAELEMMKAMASLYRKKAAVMKALEGGISKDGFNEHFRYEFMTASTIKHTVGRLFAEHGLSLQMSGMQTESTISTVEFKGGASKQVPILRVQFAISLCDVDTGAREESFWFGEAGATDDKAASKAATSALKYFFISNLLIADKEEDERDTDNQKAPSKSEQRLPKKDKGASTSDHWSTDAAIMERMYKWSLDTHNVNAQGVKAAIAATGRPITSMSGDEVKALIAEYARRAEKPRS